MQDLEITCFNLCKKLGQLSKVVQYLQVGVADREFQVEAIRKKYEKIETKLFLDYEKKATSIIGEIEKEIDFDAPKRIYASKREVINQRFVEFKETTISQFNAMTNEVDNGILMVKNEIAKIRNELEAQIKENFENSSKYTQEISQRIKDSEFQSKKDLIKYDNETRSKYNKYSKEREEFLEKYEKEKKAEREEIRAQLKNCRSTVKYDERGLKLCLLMSDNIKVDLKDSIF